PGAGGGPGDQDGPPRPADDGSADPGAGARRLRADRDEAEQAVRAPEDRGRFPRVRQVLRERAPRVVRGRGRQAGDGGVPGQEALTQRAHSFSRASSTSTPSPGPSSARIAPSRYCTGLRVTSPSRSSGPNSSQPHVTGVAASAIWRYAAVPSEVSIMQPT